MSAVNFRQLLALMVALALVGLLVSCRGLSDGLMQPYTTRWIVSLLMGTGLVSMGVLTCHRHNYDTSRRQHQQLFLEGDVISGNWNSVYVDHMGFFLEKYASTIGIYIFGAGSIFLRVFYTMGSVECIKYCYEYGPMWNVTYDEAWQVEDETLGHAPGEGHAPDRIDTIPREELSLIVIHLISVVFFAAQIPFLHTFSQFHRLRRSFRAHHATIIIIAADFGVWLFIFLQESEVLSNYHPQVLVNKTQSSFASSCLGHTTVMDRYQEGTLEHVLFPLTLEFMLASLEVLIEVWLLRYVYRAPSPSPESTPVLRRRERNNYWTAGFVVGVAAGSHLVTGPGITGADGEDGAGHQGGAANMLQDVARDSEDGDLDDDDDYDDDLDRTVHTFQCMPVPRNFYIPPAQSDINNKWYHIAWICFIRAFNVYTALLFGIIEAALIKFYMLHEKLPETDPQYLNDENFNLYYKLPTLLGRILLAGVPGLLVAVHCVAIMKTFKEKRPNAPKLFGSDVILILAAIGVIFITCFEEIICISQLVKNDHSTNMVLIYLVSALEALLYLPQILLSALIIYYGQRWMANVHHRYYCTLQRSLTFLAMYSFTQWAIDSFLEVAFLNSRTELREVESWKIFVHLFVPPCIYFRYLSIILFLKVKNLLREVEVKNQLVRSHRQMSRYGSTDST